MVSQVADFRKLHQFLNAESVLTIATADDCGSWSAPVLYVADTFVTGADVKAVKFSLYFLSSPNSRHIKSLPDNGSAAVSIYSDYNGDWRSICGAQIQSTITQVEDKERVAELYFARFPEIRALIDGPANDQERLIGAAFGRSNFYAVTPSFVRFTNNGDSFAGRTQWQL